MPILKIKDSNNNWVGVPVTKGDTGENAYIWIKYSATQPTADSDMTDTPSPWIGLYSGTSDSAPSHYTDYTWYKFKGEQGEQGEPGETGATPDFSIGTVTTGAAGSSASASITGTAEHPVLNLTIPRGNTGEVTEAQLLALLPTDSVSGAVVSFPDGADDVPMESLSVTLEPIQDLHGYSAPWVGGSGKNLFNKDDNNSLVAGYIASSAFSTSNTKGCTVYVPISPSTEYTVSKKAGLRFQVATSPNAPADGVGFTAKQNDPSGTSITITSGASDAYLWAWVYLKDTDTGTLDEMLATVQIEAGSTPSSYEPYENLCPISGFTGCNLYRTPVVYPFTQGGLGDSNGTETTTNTRIRTDFIPYNNELTIKLIGIGLESSDRTRRIYWYDSSKTFISSNTLDGGSQELPYTYTGFTAPNGTAYYRICMQKLVSSENISASGKMLSINPNVYAITWQTEAGTVYGVTLDVVSGVMTVDMALVDLGTLDYTIASSAGISAFRNNIGAKPVSDNNQHGITSAYPFAGTRFIASMPDKSWMIDSSGRFYIRDDTYTTAEGFKLAMNGQQLCYELATSISYQLSETEITTLLGDNTVWSDSGDVAVTYKANIQKYIDKKIAEL